MFAYLCYLDSYVWRYTVYLLQFRHGTTEQALETFIQMIAWVTPEMNFSVHIFVWYVADNGLRVPIIAHIVKARCTNLAVFDSKF